MVATGGGGGAAGAELGLIPCRGEEGRKRKIIINFLLLIFRRAGDRDALAGRLQISWSRVEGPKSEHRQVPVYTESVYFREF